MTRERRGVTRALRAERAPDRVEELPAEIYADGPGAHWLTDPLPVTITRRVVTSRSRLTMVLAPGGGQAIRIRPAT